MTSPVRVTVTAHGPVSVVSVAGEIDLATARLLRHHLTALIDAGRIRLDLSIRGTLTAPREAPSAPVRVATRRDLTAW